jgi:hypothetical protein
MPKICLFAHLSGCVITNLPRLASFAAVLVSLWSRPAVAEAPHLWLSPMDNVTQRGEDFPRFFTDPRSWTTVAKRVAVFKLPLNYLLSTPAETVARGVALLRADGIKLAVEISAVTVDKHICGDGMEGMIWPHEAALAARKLKARGVDVEYFAFDLPLTAGHISTDRRSCHLSIPDTANRLAVSVRELRAVYPHVRFVDEEVPTGIRSQVWLSDLAEWLLAYRTATGEDFDGLTMDVWWKFEWHDVVRESARMLAARNIRAGVFIDSTGGRTTTAVDWVADARANACAVRDLNTPLDYLVIANWMDAQVKNLPETDSTSLSGLFLWIGAGTKCQ